MVPRTVRISAARAARSNHLRRFMRASILRVLVLPDPFEDAGPSVSGLAPGEEPVGKVPHRDELDR